MGNQISNSHFSIPKELGWKKNALSLLGYESNDLNEYLISRLFESIGSEQFNLAFLLNSNEFSVIYEGIYNRTVNNGDLRVEMKQKLKEQDQFVSAAIKVNSLCFNYC